MMLLAIDVGHTNIVFGICEGDALGASWSLATSPDCTADELWVLGSRLFAQHGIEPGQIDGVVLASVVPPLTHAVTEMVARDIGHPIVVAGAETADLTIAYEQPSDVGADRLVWERRREP